MVIRIAGGLPLLIERFYILSSQLCDYLKDIQNKLFEGQEVRSIIQGSIRIKKYCTSSAETPFPLLPLVDR